MIIFSTSTTLPCPPCGAEVPPRHRRIVDDPRAPLCEKCVTAAGLAQVDAVLDAAATLEKRLETVKAEPLGFDELVQSLEAVCRRAIDLAEQHLAHEHADRS